MRERLLDPVQYAAGDVTWFGLGSHRFDWGEQKTIEIPVPVGFKPAQLYCPSVAAGLLVLEISINGQELLVPGAAVPVELFSEVSTCPQPDWPFMPAGTVLRFRLQAMAKPAAVRPDLKWWRRFWSAARRGARAAKRRRFVRWLLEPEPEPRPPTFTGAFYGFQPRRSPVA